MTIWHCHIVFAIGQITNYINNQFETIIDEYRITSSLQIIRNLLKDPIWHIYKQNWEISVADFELKIYDNHGSYFPNMMNKSEIDRRKKIWFSTLTFLPCIIVEENSIFNSSFIFNFYFLCFVIEWLAFLYIYCL